MATRMPIAKLNIYIRIQRKVLTADVAGGKTEKWKDIAITWAAVKEFGTVAGMQRSFETMRLQQEITHDVTIRYNFALYHDLRTGDRIWRKELPHYHLEVIAWRATDDNRYLNISCREVRP